jgi:hypothetical protein
MDPQLLAEARAAARVSVEPRRRRLARLAGVHASQSVAIERAIVANLEEGEARGDIQPELFSRAAARALDDARERAQERSIALREYIDVARLTAEIETGHATLEVVLVPR